MNLFQAFLVMVLAVLVAVVMFSLNGEPGNKYGIPYSDPDAIGIWRAGLEDRRVPARVASDRWYGIGTWIAALALDGILTTLVGFTAPWAKYVYFVAAAGRADRARVRRHPDHEVVQRVRLVRSSPR